MKRTTRFFKALSDKSRLQILWLIFHRGEASLVELQRLLAIPESRVLGHLKYLANAGIILYRMDGGILSYRLMQQSDPFRRVTLEGLKVKLADREVSTPLEQRLRK